MLRLSLGCFGYSSLQQPAGAGKVLMFSVVYVLPHKLNKITKENKTFQDDSSDYTDCN